ncbi:TlpA family protein disulfide reductase [Microbispora hainanensis]|uniref:TlpA family protein disulfide reductase n=1 Tax=Microbispora hainanensis TaxID=568844 RepID=UPI00142EC008|nr:TlpA disulfide reductase family protein [Microbispora hainanensis]
MVATMVLIGMLSALNLLLSVGVIRRLREHSAELATLRSGGTAPNGGPFPLGEVALPDGSPIGEFTAVTVDGEPVTLGTFGVRPLVGFFSPGCTPCEEQLPAFVEFATGRPGGRDTRLAVVVGTGEEAAKTVERLNPVATVVVESDDGPVQKAFGVTGFPAFILVANGLVAASHYQLGAIIDHDAAALSAAG